MRISPNCRLFRSQAGFTLIEIMVVVVILGILASIVVPRLIGREEQAKRTSSAVQIKNFEEALSLFKLDNGFYPDTEQGLQALVSPPTNGREARNWREGGYLKKVPKDPWGNAYIYLSPGLHDPYDIISYGNDGVAGGEGENADVESWSIE